MQRYVKFPVRSNMYNLRTSKTLLQLSITNIAQSHQDQPRQTSQSSISSLVYKWRHFHKKTLKHRGDPQPTWKCNRTGIAGKTKQQKFRCGSLFSGSDRRFPASRTFLFGAQRRELRAVKLHLPSHISSQWYGSWIMIMMIWNLGLIEAGSCRCVCVCRGVE